MEGRPLPANQRLKEANKEPMKMTWAHNNKVGKTDRGVEVDKTTSVSQLGTKSRGK